MISIAVKLAGESIKMCNEHKHLHANANRYDAQDLILALCWFVGV